MPRVIWDPDAEDDLRTIAYSIGVEGQSPRGARNVIRDIREKCALYATQPLSGRARPELDPDLRSFVVRDFVALYFPMDDGIYVARVFRGSQDYPRLFTKA